MEQPAEAPKARRGRSRKVADTAAVAQEVEEQVAAATRMPERQPGEDEEPERTINWNPPRPVITDVLSNESKARPNEF